MSTPSSERVTLYREERSFGVEVRVTDPEPARYGGGSYNNHSWLSREVRGTGWRSAPNNTGANKSGAASSYIMRRHVGHIMRECVGREFPNAPRGRSCDKLQDTRGILDGSDVSDADNRMLKDAKARLLYVPNSDAKHNYNDLSTLNAELHRGKHRYLIQASYPTKVVREGGCEGRLVEDALLD
ncbi:hypothetical protein C8R44DRAFT_732036 [Mycena epipterygia]|nr:hypothetical protein C8R44DRAFT_732036 [Mycena epipterygia]